VFIHSMSSTLLFRTLSSPKRSTANLGLNYRCAATDSTFTRMATITAGARLSKVLESDCLISASAFSKMTFHASKNG
jgi:hypothetical protein